MMLDGTVIPVSHTISSPKARNTNKTPHCTIIFI